MKAISISNWGLLYLTLGFVVFVYAIPDNIMSYGWANSLVDATAQFVPAMEKLKQAYERQLVTGVALFLHAVKWILVVVLLMALPKVAVWNVGRERDWLDYSPIWRLLITVSILVVGWVLGFLGESIDVVLSGSTRGGKWFQATYIFAPTMGVMVALYLMVMLVGKEILVAIAKRKK